jgi:hypothetical protein
MKSFIVYLLLAILLLLNVSCETNNEVEPVVELHITAVLSENGTESLYKDTNQYYHLTLDTSRHQTIRRVNGFIKVNGEKPFSPEKVVWESNLYWYLLRGDTVANIVETYFNPFTGKLTTVILPPLIAQKDELVPTINCCSYSGTEGEINTMIAPIKDMKGDTLIIRAYNWTYDKTAITKIILE